jgi:hypothetical protein
MSRAVPSPRKRMEKSIQQKRNKGIHKGLERFNTTKML